MSKFFQLCLAPLIAVSLLNALPAQAQHKPSHNMMMPMMGGGMMMPMMMNHPEGYFSFLKTELGITEAQNSLWTSYREQSQPLIAHFHNAMPMMGAQPAPAQPSWMERLEKGEAMMAEHLEAIRKVKPAATALYADLSPDQKKKADQLMPGAMGMPGMPMAMPGMN